MNIQNLLIQWEAAAESLQRNTADTGTATETSTLNRTLHIRTGLKAGKLIYGRWMRQSGISDQLYRSVMDDENDDYWETQSASCTISYQDVPC